MRRIIAEADREKARIIAEANEQARRLDGEGEAEATRVYATEFGADPAFFKFIRALEAYDRILDDKTTLFLPADSELLRMLQPHAAAAQDLNRPPKTGPRNGEVVGDAVGGQAANVTRGFTVTVRRGSIAGGPGSRGRRAATSRLARSCALGRCRLSVLLIAAYLGTGFHLVAVDEQALVRRLGAPHARLGPGMHWMFPWPIDRVDVLKTTSVSKVGVGFALPQAEQETVIGMELLTGDTNILSIALVLQYVIRDPADFLLRVEDARALIGGLGESVLTNVFAGMAVDEVLTTGRLAIQDSVKIQTQELLDRYRSGVQVTSFQHPGHDA